MPAKSVNDEKAKSAKRNGEAENVASVPDMENKKVIEVQTPRARNRYTSALREKSKSDTRARIINAALTSIKRTGYQDTTIDQIVRLAGVTKPTFYAYFRDKIDLANDIGASLVTEMTPLFAALDQLEHPTLKDVRRWLDRMVEFRNKHRATLEAVTDATVNDPNIIGDYVNTLVRTVEQYMPNYLARFKGKQREKARGHLILLQLQLDRFLFITAIRDARFPGPDMLDLLAEIWLEALLRRTFIAVKR